MMRWWIGCSFGFFFAAGFWAGAYLVARRWKERAEEARKDLLRALRHANSEAEAWRGLVEWAEDPSKQ